MEKNKNTIDNNKNKKIDERKQNTLVQNGIISRKTINNKLFVFQEPSYKVGLLFAPSIEILEQHCIYGDIDELYTLNNQEKKSLVNNVYKDWGYVRQKKDDEYDEAYNIKQTEIMLVSLCKYFPGWTVEQIIEYPLSKINSIMKTLPYITGKKKLKKREGGKQCYDKEQAIRMFKKKAFG